MTQKVKLPCISLIGMAGAGKSTIAAKLAQAMGWAYMDSDNLIEALYAARLQDVTDAMTREQFLDMECEMICSIRASKCVIATGGSVVYRPRAMAHLASLGPIVHISLSLERILERIARNPERGLVIAPGQSIADIYAERLPLYEKFSSFACDSGEKNPEQCAAWLIEVLGEKYGIFPDQKKP